MTPNYHIYEILSENFDLNSAKDKIRIRSLQHEDNLKDNEYALISPLYETPLLEEVVDDNRFSIDMSAMKGFNNVIEDLDMGRYRSIFKWIDNAYTDLVYSLIPKTTNFMGINFVYESHVLERNKFKYLFDEIYLKALPRDPNRSAMLLSQLTSKICKF